ncbi:hypothetical protein, partial [Meridianimarinicoccus zhengii]|uniref:hypothetical protein n=1 Tax=Meridianimarinicoccus zhengii TaxID=2056810 RepID=UPI001C9AFE01
TDAGSGVASPASNAVTVLTGASATLAEIDSPEDVAVFDYGHALGLETADIPLELDSTDADDGAVIECRWVQYHGKGTANPDTPTGEAGDWTALGDPVSGGAASGALTITGKDVRTYRLIECRVQGSAAPASTMARKIALGHVHYDLGQSNLTKKFAADSPVTLTPDTITYPDYVQFWEPDRSDPATTGPSLVTLVNNEPGNEPMPGLARDVEVFHAAHPGEYLVLAMGAVPGVNPFEWIDPADTSRVWEHDMRMLSDLTDYGTKIGTVINSSWSSFFPQNAESMMPVLTGRNFDGSPAVLGSTLPNGETLHHSLSEVIDFDYTRVVVIVSTGRGPRTTDFPRDSLTAILNSPTGAESIAAGWETILLDKATFPEILGEPYNPETFALRGYPDGGGWSTDMIHFSNTEPSGFPRLAEVMASIKLRALGSISYDTPRITHSNWTETHIDLWNPDLDFTTERNRKGGTSAYIGGFTLDGVPLRTEVQLLPDAGGSGRTGIRITPAGGVNGAETLEYGRGGSPDLLVYPDDLLNTYVDDLPVAVVAGSLVPSLPLAVRPEITSNLEGTPQFTLDGSQGSFVDPDEIGTVNGFTLAGEFRRNSGGGGTISTTLGAVYNFEMLSDGRARISVDTPEGSIGMQQTANVVWPNGEWVPFVWTVDFINGTTTIWYGDTGEETFALTGTGAALSTTRQFRYPTGSLVADVRFTEVFKAPTAVRDTTALGTPHKRLYAGAGGTILTPSLPVWGSESVAS